MPEQTDWCTSDAGRPRRYLIEAEEDLPKEQRGGNHPVSEFIRLIAQLFAIEARSEDLTPEQRQKLRQAGSQPVLDQIEELLSRHLNTVLPQSGFGKAFQSLRGQWPKRSIRRRDQTVHCWTPELALRCGVGAGAHREVQAGKRA
ncbi:IS66 family transposase [Paraburkholderia caribensis]|uniref:IS66 family transposase n=1 Tax=Paraburkholderia caribensis TaxID=75105 RepID=UPI0034D15F82